MTMHINLSSEMESFIKGKVASSFYGNATEVIRDAIRRMQSEEDRVLAWRSAVQKGNAELDRGEGMVYTAQALGERQDDFMRLKVEGLLDAGEVVVVALADERYQERVR